MNTHKITYQFFDAQREFLEIPHDYSIDVAVYQGGYGSGKTFCGSLLGILLCLKYPGIRGLVGAKTYTSCPSFLKLSDKCSIEIGTPPIYGL